jgi:hypothetical protein
MWRAPALSDGLGDRVFIIPSPNSRTGVPAAAAYMIRSPGALHIPEHSYFSSSQTATSGWAAKAGCASNMQTGTRVLVHGLRTVRGQLLNGKHGIVTAAADDTGHCVVAMCRTAVNIATANLIRDDFTLAEHFAGRVQ